MHTNFERSSTYPFAVVHRGDGSKDVVNHETGAQFATDLQKPSFAYEVASLLKLQLGQERAA